MTAPRHRRWSRWALGSLAVALMGAPGCRVTDVPLWGPSCPEQAKVFDVQKVTNIAYTSGPDCDLHRHQLDLFLPRGQKEFPVVLLVHGGAWIMGDNHCCGLYSSVGEFLASQGIGVALCNYRLSPGVKHPEHVKDVARAFAWVHNHIAEYGGNTEAIFVAGHSAGGHLVSLLATDETYLKGEGLSARDIKGVISLSGVYRIPTGKFEFTLGGATPRSLNFDEMAPLRGDGGWSLGRQWALPGIPLSLDVFGPSFGNDARVREEASPVKHVRHGLPPFLLLCAENDLPALPEMAEEFHQALRDQGCDSCFLRVKDRNHNSIMFRAIAADDPVARAILEFIRAQTR